MKKGVGRRRKLDEGEVQEGRRGKRNRRKRE